MEARDRRSHSETGALADLAQTVAQLPQVARPQIKEFTGNTAGAARQAAAEWLSDFQVHGPLEIGSIRTSFYDGKFIAVVAFHPA